MTKSLADEAEELIRYDWVETKSGRLLHGWVPTREELNAFAFNWAGYGITTACGRTADVWIPGWFTRQQADRCKRCCKAMGLPVGKGSPKNDPACRPLVGLRPSDEILTEIIADHS